MRRLILSALVAAFAIIFAAGCGAEDKPTAQQNEGAIRNSNYERLAIDEPAKTMKVSPTRATINSWIETWGQEKGKPAYSYLQNADGKVTSYYVFKGPPVSMCVGLTPPYEFVNVDGGSDYRDHQVPAPSMDAVYYGGCIANEYYGTDLATGAVVDFTVGLSQSLNTFSEPLARQIVGDAPAMTKATAP